MSARPHGLALGLLASLVLSCGSGTEEAPLLESVESAEPASAAATYALKGGAVECAAGPRGVADGELARDLELLTCSGERFRLSETCGGYGATLLNFEKAWCVACVRQMPKLVVSVRALDGRGGEGLDYTIVQIEELQRGR